MEICFEDLKSYCTPEVMDYLRSHNRPLPYIYVLMETPCVRRECQHNILNGQQLVSLRRIMKVKQEPRDCQENEYTRSIANCMCLVHTPVNAEELTRIFNFKNHRSIQLIEKSAMKNFGKAWKRASTKREVEEASEIYLCP